jgi:hypothetical protein
MSVHRQRVVRADGQAIDVVQRRAHLSYSFTGCCCGRTERGYAPVPAELFKEERLRGARGDVPGRHPPLSAACELLSNLSAAADGAMCQLSFGVAGGTARPPSLDEDTARTPA